jgi:hypothetical protein
VNRLSPHQLMEVLTMIQQASSMPTVRVPPPQPPPRPSPQGGRCLR